MTNALVNLADIDFTQPQHSGYFVVLSHLALVHVSGKDAETFLQGQFSNDISQIEPDSSQLNAYCTPKGRIIATLWVCRNGQDFWLILPQDNVKNLVDKLKIYVMRAKVQITHAQSHQLIGQIGSGAVSALSPSIPEAQYSLPQHCQLAIPETTTEPIAAPTSLPAQWLIVPSSTFTQAQMSTTMYHFDLWRYMNIVCGIPQIYAATGEKFIPQYINLDLIDGVNFKKGCYPGQEIVARLQYLGKTKQRLFLLRIQTEDSILAGESIATKNDNQQSVGTIVESVRLNATTTFATAVLNTQIADTQLTLSMHSEAIITVDTLPYAI